MQDFARIIQGFLMEEAICRTVTRSVSESEL
jgi:hypothetical protein